MFMRRDEKFNLTFFLASFQIECGGVRVGAPRVCYAGFYDGSNYQYRFQLSNFLSISKSENFFLLRWPTVQRFVTTIICTALTHDSNRKLQLVMVLMRGLQLTAPQSTQKSERCLLEHGFSAWLSAQVLNCRQIEWKQLSIGVCVCTAASSNQNIIKGKGGRAWEKVHMVARLWAASKVKIIIIPIVPMCRWQWQWARIKRCHLSSRNCSCWIGSRASRALGCIVRSRYRARARQPSFMEYILNGLAARHCAQQS